MKNHDNFTSTKEETAEAELKMVSDGLKKENVEKTNNAVKDTAKNVKTKATKATAAVKTTAKKTVSKKVDIAFYVQYQGKEISKHTILEKIHDEWVKSHKMSELKTLDVYLKVEDNMAYCLINGKIKIDLKLS